MEIYIRNKGILAYTIKGPAAHRILNNIADSRVKLTTTNPEYGDADILYRVGEDMVMKMDHGRDSLELCLWENSTMEVYL